MKSSLLGFFFGILYCIITAISIIYIYHVNHDIDPMISSLFTFLLGTVFFHLVNLNKIKATYLQLIPHRKIYSYVNVSTLLTWMTTFFALVYVDPVLYIALFMLSMPISTYLIGLFQKKEKFSGKKILFFSIFIFLGALLIIKSSQVFYRGNVEALQIGTLLSVIAGFAGGAYIVSSKMLQVNGNFSSTQVLSLRFHFLIIICFVWILLHHTLHHFLRLPFLSLAILSILTSILPMYCMQKALSYMSPLKFSFLTPFTIIFAYILLLITMHYHNLLIAFILFFLTLFLVGYQQVNKK